METVEILIRIPQVYYDYILSQRDTRGTPHLAEAICNGVVFPKGHGRLIDADALIKWLKIYNERYNKRFAKTPIKDIPMYDLGHRNRNDDVISQIYRFLTVIEADREE